MNVVHALSWFVMVMDKQLNQYYQTFQLTVEPESTFIFFAHNAHVLQFWNRIFNYMIA